MDDSFETKISFSDLKSLSVKSLKSLKVSRITKTCKSLLKRTPDDSEIYKYILNDLFELIEIPVEDLESELFALIFPEIVDHFKTELQKLDNNIASLVSLQGILSNVSNYMYTKVFPDHPNILHFDHFCSSTLEIIRESFGYLKERNESLDYSEDVEQFMESTMKYYSANLKMLSESAYFFEDVPNHAMKFYNCLSALLDIANITEDFVAVFGRTWLTIFNISNKNSSEIIKRIDCVEIVSSLEHLMNDIAETLQRIVNRCVLGENPFKILEMLTKHLKTTSEIYNSNLKGFQKYISTLINLMSLQYDEDLDQELKDKIHSSVTVGYMVSFQNVYKSPSFQQDLFKIESTDPIEIINHMTLCSHILTLIFQDPDESTLLQFCPANNENLFCQIIKRLSENEFILYDNEILYRELVLNLSCLMIACGKHKSSFEFMEDTLVRNLVNGKFLVGMLCVDIWILLARVVPQTTVIKYFQFCESFHLKTSSMMSSNLTSIFLKILLKNFYRILAPKYQKTLDLNDKLKMVVGLDAIRNSDDKNEILQKFAREADVIFIKGEMATAGDFYKMLESLKLASTTKSAASPEFVSTLRKLLKFLQKAKDLRLFNSFLITAFEVIHNTDDPTKILQYLMSLSEFLSKNRNRLDFEVKVKLVELLEHFIRKCPQNGVNARNMIAVEVKRLVQNDPVLDMLIYQLFMENPRNFVLKQVKEICPEVEEILCNEFQIFDGKKELLVFLKTLGSQKAKKHECKVREIIEEETLIDVDLMEIAQEDFSSSQKRKQQTSMSNDLFDELDSDELFTNNGHAELPTQLSCLQDQISPPHKRQKSYSIDEIVAQTLQHSKTLLNQKKMLSKNQIAQIHEAAQMLNKITNF